MSKNMLYQGRSAQGWSLATPHPLFWGQEYGLDAVAKRTRPVSVPPMRRWANA
jgi:hypothetical protein